MKKGSLSLTEIAYWIIGLFLLIIIIYLILKSKSTSLSIINNLKELI